MNSSETCPNQGEWGRWECELGIRVPIAPVLIQLDYGTYPEVSFRSSGASFPDKRNFSWLTMSLKLPDYLSEEYDGYLVINPRGEASNLGISIPKCDSPIHCIEEKREEYYQPFWFFQDEGMDNKVVPINAVEIIKGKRRLVVVDDNSSQADFRVELETKQVESEGVRLWLVGHEFVNSLITREMYLVGQLEEPTDMEEILLGVVRMEQRESIFGMEKVEVKAGPHINRVSLISGREARGKKVGLLPSQPLAMLFGNDQPILVGKGRIFDRGLERFSG